MICWWIIGLKVLIVGDSVSLYFVGDIVLVIFLGESVGNGDGSIVGESVGSKLGLFVNIVGCIIYNRWWFGWWWYWCI